jgi:hypothetical protein
VLQFPWPSERLSSEDKGDERDNGSNEQSEQSEQSDSLADVMTLLSIIHGGIRDGQVQGFRELSDKERLNGR